jgi:hypothetical protein
VATQEADIVRKCLMRGDQQVTICGSALTPWAGVGCDPASDMRNRAIPQCTFFEYRGYKIAYRRYASLFFIVGADEDENELAVRAPFPEQSCAHKDTQTLAIACPRAR